MILIDGSLLQLLIINSPRLSIEVMQEASIWKKEGMSFIKRSSSVNANTSFNQFITFLKKFIPLSTSP